MTENCKWNFSSEPEEFASKLRVASVEVTAIGRGPYLANMSQVRLERLWLQRTYTSFSKIARVENNSSRTGLNFRTASSSSRLIGGAEVSPDTIVRCAPQQAFFERFVGPADISGMSISNESLVTATEALYGVHSLSTSNAGLYNPHSAQLAELRRLHAATIKLLDDAPELLANSAAARGLEEELLGAMVACLVPTRENNQSLIFRRHAVIMKRFYEVTNERIDQPLYIAEVCKAIGISLQTLRVCCNEALGMSPMRYLWLRRMHKVRHALLIADWQNTSVTTVALAHGFWELGRFSVQYKSLFGEQPSSTLRRPYG